MVEQPPERESAGDMDGFIEERERLDQLFKEKFTKNITVMFTDLKGSTTIAETHGDFASRSLIKQHNDILFPLIRANGGTLVKTMGDGTMSYFGTPLEAVRAAAGMQKGIDAFNLSRKIAIPVLVRIGIHTGQGIVEHNDIFGDVVNVASRIEGQANPGEIYLSEEAYNALSDRTEIPCAFAKEALLKGKKEPVRLYKAFWNPAELEKEPAPAAPPPAPAAGTRKRTALRTKLILSAIAALLAVLAVFRLAADPRQDETRTKKHSVKLKSSQ
ncbi:MAG: adenylate/guanylate cyclase domain-containing protein [Elusimicrobia bacterium]|nr:adenylate/guanylate cyclase domain-containing protein [Elusimicrobiota bacterium]